jgi:hypothetical protein
MIFYTGKNLYCGASAVEIAQKIERDCQAYPQKGGTVRDFIFWSLLQLEGQLPLREIAVSDKVSDETLALSYLCLLDQYRLGKLDYLSEQNVNHRLGVNAR